MMWMVAAIGLGGVSFATPALANNQMVPAKDSPQIQEKMQGVLGSEWDVAVQKDALVATRKQPQAASNDTQSKIKDEVKDLRQSNKKMTTKVKGDTAHLGGKIDDCSKLPGTAQDLASIQGINKIVVDAHCGK
jgi:hypothetical protein